MNLMKSMNYLLVTMVVVLLFGGTAMAHKVNLFAYAEGGKIFTESYFPDGKPVEGGKVQVYDSQGQLILEGVSDKDGLYSFDIPKIDDFNIVINATMGHKNSFKLKKSEVEAGK